MMLSLRIRNRLGIFTGGLVLLTAVSGLALQFEEVSISVEDSFIKRDEEIQSKIDVFVNDGFDLGVGKTSKEITKALGPPEKSKVQKVKNPYYPSEMDEVQELFYRDLYIRIHKVGATRNEFITNISVSSDRYKLKWGLNVGSQKSAVKRVLGRPDRDEQNLFEYESDNDSVTFHFSNEVVSKIAWSFYLD